MDSTNAIKALPDNIRIISPELIEVEQGQGVKIRLAKWQGIAVARSLKSLSNSELYNINKAKRYAQSFGVLPFNIKDKLFEALIDAHPAIALPAEINEFKNRDYGYSNFLMRALDSLIHGSIISRGKSLQSKITITNINPDLRQVEATCQGGELYKLKIEFNTQNSKPALNYYCTCPYSAMAPCKHLVALLLVCQNAGYFPEAAIRGLQLNPILPPKGANPFETYADKALKIAKDLAANLPHDQGRKQLAYQLALDIFYRRVVPGYEINELSVLAESFLQSLGEDEPKPPSVHMRTLRNLIYSARRTQTNTDIFSNFKISEAKKVGRDYAVVCNIGNSANIHNPYDTKLNLDIYYREFNAKRNIYNKYKKLTLQPINSLHEFEPPILRELLQAFGCNNTFSYSLEKVNQIGLPLGLQVKWLLELVVRNYYLLKKNLMRISLHLISLSKMLSRFGRPPWKFSKEIRRILSTHFADIYSKIAKKSV